VNVQNGPSASPGVVSESSSTRQRTTSEHHTVTQQDTDESYAKKQLPSVKSTLGRRFRWHRSQSVDNIPQAIAAAAAVKPVEQAKPKTKTTPANKGIHTLIEYAVIDITL